MKKKRAAKRESGRAVQEAVKLDTLERINLNAAGLDIGAEEIYACVPDGRDAEGSVRVYGTYTTDLYGLADWLARCQLDTVAMESTEVYWIPVFEILEARGYKVYLVNARQSKNVSGRKTDVLDCQWIQQLHTYGLLSNSFRPEGEICALRAYLRHRDNLIRYRSGHIQHMQKALQLMNVQLTQAVSDVTGATGMRIIRAIVTGERDPQALARHRDPRCAKSAEEIAQAFIGLHFNAAVECSAFGSRIRWPGEGQPEDVMISPVVESPQDVEDLEVPNACLDGLFPADLDSYCLMRKELADRGLDVPMWMGYGIRGPFTLAAMLSGGLPAGVFNESSMKRLLDWVNNQPEVAHELIDKCTQTIAAYIGALWKFMGIEQEIMLCDDFSCYLTPEQFEEFSAPYLARIYKKLDHPLNMYHIRL